MERGVSWLRCNNCGTAGVESYAGSTPGGVTYKSQYRECEGAISIGPTSAQSTLEGGAKEPLGFPQPPCRNLRQLNRSVPFAHAINWRGGVA